MKVVSRIGCFETNSSSVHTITIASNDEYEKWRNQEFIYDMDNNELVPISEVSVEDLNASDSEHEDFDYKRFYTHEEFFDGYDMEYEVFSVTKTINNERVVAFGYYGHNG